MIVIVMGVSGCGKSTVAEALSKRLGGEFLDADAFHSPSNIIKMANGIPLTDSDRESWLTKLALALSARAKRGQSVFLACSALKESYRKVLSVDPCVRFVYLKGDYDLIAQRMRQRTGHYMKETLLRSQFAVLEEPTNAVIISINADRDTIINQALAGLGH